MENLTSKAMSSFPRNYAVLFAGKFRYILLAAGLGVLSSALDIAGMVLLPVFLVTVFYPAADASASLHAKIPSGLLHFDQGLIVLLISIVFLFRGLLHVMSTYVSTNLSQKLRKSLSREICESYLYCDFENLVDRPVGKIVAVVNNYCEIFANQVALPIMRLISEIFMVLAIITFLAYIDFQVVLVISGVLFGFGLIYFFSIRRLVKSLSIKIRDSYAEHLNQIMYAFRGPREVRVLNLQGRMMVAIQEALEVIRDVRTRQAWLQSVPRAVGELSAISLAAMYMVYKGATDADGSEILAYMGIYSLAGLRLIGGFTQILSNSAQIRSGGDVVDSLAMELQGRHSMIADVTGPTLGVALRDSYRAGALEPFLCLELENVAFRYQDQKVPVFENLQFRINKGESVGIVGPSGSGKSTLTDLLLGLLAAQSGVFRINGAEVEPSDINWRGRFGFVPQSPFIANDSVARNVAFGTPLAEIDYPRLNNALDMAQLSDVVNNMEHGIHENVGDLGGKISGGQRQRLAIARALYFQREIIVFDEATSSLDLETEGAVVDAIASLKPKLTTIVVAHRWGTLRSCDRIYSMKDGVLSEVDPEAVKRAMGS